MAQQGSHAYVTLLTSESYLPGVMVLAHSLRDGSTRKQLACMVASDLLSGNIVSELRMVYDHVIPVDRIHNPSPTNLYLMDRPDLSSAFTKINLWRQTQYKRIVYIDADVVALRAPDELFALEEPFSAAPDIGWPDCFNSGVMALTPNMGDYYALKALADRGISFDGADQGLFNMHFRNYNRLSFAYNCTPSGNYQYVPAYRHFQSTISLVHFIGREKPWMLGREYSGGGAGISQEMLGRWWAEYDRHYRVPTTAAVSGQAPPNARIVQQFVTGDQHLTYGYHSSSSSAPSRQFSAPSIHVQQSSLSSQTHSIHDQQLSQISEEPADDGSTNNDLVREPHGSTAPPVVEQRRFSAPHAEWDPIKQAPPAHAKPEAANFPSETYIMSANRELWQAPISYPEPPKNMWYEVPKTREVQSKPRPIFPWEEKQAPPTRVFAEDRLLPPTPDSSDEISSSQHELTNSPIPSGGDELSVSPPTRRSPVEALSSGETSVLAPFPTRIVADTFLPTTVPFSEYKGSNAWDEDDGIGRYVSILQRRRKGGTQVLLSQDLSNLIINSPDERRGSVRITEFPTAVERPSLPVTPAPIRREMFWGSDRDTQSNLPEAEGVPAQVEWNPEQQLENLRRNSLLFANASPNTNVGLPERNHPKSSQEIVISPSQEGGRNSQNLHSGDVSPGAIIRFKSR